MNKNGGSPNGLIIVESASPKPNIKATAPTTKAIFIPFFIFSPPFASVGF